MLDAKQKKGMTEKIVKRYHATNERPRYVARRYPQNHRETFKTSTRRLIFYPNSDLKKLMIPSSHHLQKFHFVKKFN